METTIFHGATALYLVSYPWFVNAGNARSKIVFQVTPTVLGMILAFETYAKFMGVLP